MAFHCDVCGCDLSGDYEVCPVCKKLNSILLRPEGGETAAPAGEKKPGLTIEEMLALASTYGGSRSDSPEQKVFEPAPKEQPLQAAGEPDAPQKEDAPEDIEGFGALEQPGSQGDIDGFETEPAQLPDGQPAEAEDSDGPEAEAAEEPAVDSAGDSDEPEAEPAGEPAEGPDETEAEPAGDSDEPEAEAAGEPAEGPDEQPVQPDAEPAVAEDPAGPEDEAAEDPAGPEDVIPAGAAGEQPAGDAPAAVGLLERQLMERAAAAPKKSRQGRAAFSVMVVALTILLGVCTALFVAVPLMDMRAEQAAAQSYMDYVCGSWLSEYFAFKDRPSECCVELLTITPEGEFTMQYLLPDTDHPDGWSDGSWESTYTVNGTVRIDASTQRLMLLYDENDVSYFYDRYFVSMEEGEMYLREYYNDAHTNYYDVCFTKVA